MCIDGKCGRATQPVTALEQGVITTQRYWMVELLDMSFLVAISPLGARCPHPNCMFCGGRGPDLNNNNPPMSHEQENMSGYGSLGGTVASGMVFADNDSFRFYTTPRSRPLYHGLGTARTHRRRASRNRQQQRRKRRSERSV